MLRHNKARPFAASLEKRLAMITDGPQPLGPRRTKKNETMSRKQALPASHPKFSLSCFLHRSFRSGT